MLRAEARTLPTGKDKNACGNQAEQAVVAILAALRDSTSQGREQLHAKLDKMVASLL